MPGDDADPSSGVLGVSLLHDVKQTAALVAAEPCPLRPWRRLAVWSWLSWWSQTGSNRRPPACKAGALPTELWPRPGRNQRSDVDAAAGGRMRRNSRAPPGGPRYLLSISEGI